MPSLNRTSMHTMHWLAELERRDAVTARILEPGVDDLRRGLRSCGVRSALSVIQLVHAYGRSSSWL